MTPKMKRIYGMRIVPRRDENGLVYGGFEGIIIEPTVQGYDFIEISKMVVRDDGYYCDSWIAVPWEETIEHCKSGEEKVRFLCSQAKRISDGDEEIAICDSLIPNLLLLDYAYNQIQKILRQRQEAQ